MPDYFNIGWFVEESAWHKLGTVLDAPPATRREAMILAGHDYKVVERVNADLGGVRGNTPLTAEEFERAKFDRKVNLARVGGQWFALSVNPDKKGLRIEQIREDGTFGPLHDNSLTVVNDSFAVIQNEVAYDFATASCGRVVPPGDAASLAKAIMDFYRHPPIRHAAGMRGYQYFLEHFERQGVINKFANFIEQIGTY